MKSRLPIHLLVAATSLTGLLAGGNFVRMFIEMPAWRRTGALAWAAFSRHADLGSGLVLYPVLAIAGALLTWGATAAARWNAEARPALLPLGIASFLAASGLALTVFAAPQMLSLRHLRDDPEAIQSAFNAFDFWGNLRGIAQILAFAANLWGMARLAGSPPRYGPAVKV
jgi:hypothetical protein